MSLLERERPRLRDLLNVFVLDREGRLNRDNDFTDDELGRIEEQVANELACVGVQVYRDDGTAITVYPEARAIYIQHD
jgi:hypothetical protein